MKELNSRKLSFLVGVFTILIMLEGCSGVGRHDFTLKDNYVPKANVGVNVGVINKSKTVALDSNVEQQLKDAINTELKMQGLLPNQESNSILTLDLKVLEYSEGNAFKRHLAGNWGETSLTVTAKLKKGEKVVGTARATRSVTADPVAVATVGASEYIFSDLAKDLIGDLKSALQEATESK